MDLVRNPFAPGAGTPPPELAGRAGIVEDAEVVLQRVRKGRPVQSPILVGLRGVGKTVLLNRIEPRAQQVGFLTMFVEAHEGKRLPELLVPGLRGLLYRLSTVEAAKVHATRAIRVLKAFLGAIKITFNDANATLGLDPEVGVADSGDLEADLPDLIGAVGEAAAAAGRPICIIIDELQYLRSQEFSALVMSMHRVNQRALPMVMIGAGLPHILALAGNSKSYAERLFRFPEIGALAPDDATHAIVAPAHNEGVKFTDDAVARILETTQGYPYFLQQWAYECWNVAEEPLIDLGVVDAATDRTVAELDASFFKVRFDRCTPAEKIYMRALAELGPGAHPSGAVAAVTKRKVTALAPTRSSLIKKGMIYSPAHGATAFTVPLFDEYLQRTMPLP